MMPNMPFFLNASFLAVVFLTLLMLSLFLYHSSSLAVRNKTWMICLAFLVWILLQSAVALNGIYHADPAAMPPKIILLGVLPLVILILLVFISKSGRVFLDSLPLLQLTYLHVLRVPVELVLYGLYVYGAIPELMTFEGRNFDILAGITAPLVAYFGILKARMSRRVLLVWNFICLGLLLNIVANAVLSAPSPFQQFAFDQPNLAILYFPFSLLPAFVVPLVLFSHLASIRLLLLNRDK